MATVQNVAGYIGIDDPDLQPPSTAQYHPVDACQPLIVSADHLSTVDRCVSGLCSLSLLLSKFIQLDLQDGSSLVQ